MTRGIPIYRQVLGAGFDRLPPQVQALHDQTGGRCWRGQASVQRGRSMLARIIAGLVGLPPETASVPVQVDMAAAGNGECWMRDFGGHRFRSRLYPGQGRYRGCMVEQFGPVAVAVAYRVQDNCLYLTPQGWSLGGLPMPGFLCPGGTSFETERDGQYCFDVELTVPLLGLIVAYRGWLDSEKQ